MCDIAKVVLRGNVIALNAYSGKSGGKHHHKSQREGGGEGLGGEIKENSDLRTKKKKIKLNPKQAV